MFKLTDKKIIAMLRSKSLLIWIYAKFDLHLQVAKALLSLCISAASPSRPSDKSVHFLTKTYGVGAKKNCLNEMVLLSTHNICLKYWARK